MLSPAVAKMLDERLSSRKLRHAAIKPKPDDLVFSSPKGLPIDDHRFRARAWKAILEQCRIEYRRPYCIRHSVISHALANGINPIALAEQTGHDKRVLLSTYSMQLSPKAFLWSFEQ